LKHTIPYEAISYHWGSNTRTPFQIIIHDTNGQESAIKITSTLHTILRRLVLPDKSRTLWADAICINQISSSSNKEKGEQIQLMPDIYRIAVCVQVYLGDEADNVPAALELLSSIADYSEFLDDSIHPNGEIGLDLAVQSGFVLPPTKDKRWPALRAFFRRPWFRRVWIIQEFVYATDVSVVCGDVEIDWHRLWLASKAYMSNRQLMFHGYSEGLFVAGRLHEYREAHEGARSLHLVTDLRMRAWGYMSWPYMVFSLDKGEPSDPSGLSVRKDFAAIKAFERFSRNKWLADRAVGQSFPYPRQSLLHILHRTGNFQATQPIDRLYGLLGLAEDAEGYKPIYSAEQTVGVVSTQFAAAFINNGHLPIILATAGISSNQYSSLDRPSWVPDWTSMQYAQDQRTGFLRFSSLSEETNAKKGGKPSIDTLQQAIGDSDNATNAAEAAANEGIPEASATGSRVVNTESRPSNSQKLYNAAGDTEVVFDGDAQQGLLVVRAIPVSRVKLVLPGKLFLPAPMYETQAMKLGNVYITGEPMVEAFWRTLIANRTILGEPAPAEFALQYENMKRNDSRLFYRGGMMLMIGFIIAFPLVVTAIRFLHILAQVAGLTVLMWMRYIAVKPTVFFIILLPIFRWIYIWLLVLVLLALAYFVITHAYPVAALNVLAQMGVTTAGTTIGLPPDCAAYASSVGLVANKNALCFTEDRLMGLVPLLTQENDIVVIFHGCDVPFVIRPTEREGYYRLVGECYMHGIMNGEMVLHGAKNAVDITLI
jgi:hypothetical protein